MVIGPCCLIVRRKKIAEKGSWTFLSNSRSPKPNNVLMFGLYSYNINRAVFFSGGIIHIIIGLSANC
jgi:hypothetical protein